MSASRTPWLAVVVSFLAGAALGKGGGLFARVLQVAVLAPPAWLFVQVLAWTGDVRTALVLFVGGIVLLFVLARWGREMAALARLAWAAQRGPQPAELVSPAAGGVDPETLYRWYEPDDLPDGLVCWCGKRREAGELVYVGISWDVQSRNRNDDRMGSCWWHGSLVGTARNYPSRALVEAAERRAIKTEHPRENIAHARRASRHQETWA